jgi:hypothetical protein
VKRKCRSLWGLIDAVMPAGLRVAGKDLADTLVGVRLLPARLEEVDRAFALRASMCRARVSLAAPGVASLLRRVSRRQL